MSEHKATVDDIHCAGCLVKDNCIAQLKAENEALRGAVMGMCLDLGDTKEEAEGHIARLTEENK